MVWYQEVRIDALSHHRQRREDLENDERRVQPNDDICGGNETRSSCPRDCGQRL